MSLILGIESTCDETAASVVRGGREILSSVTSRQIDLHNMYGGVVPELASRRHLELICPVVSEALQTAGCVLRDLDAIGVAKGPGLLGALLVGINTAKGLCLGSDKPLIGVSHLEAHLYASLMPESIDWKKLFPALGLILSGGHTTLVLMHDLSNWERLGETLDDAIGEAFDKVARLLDLPYPGGPPIEMLALKGDKHAYPFKTANLGDRPYAFSFSGLKTSVMHRLQKEGVLTEKMRADVAASFQHAAFESVRLSLERAIEAYQPKSLIFGGGVTANQALRNYIPAGPTHIWPLVDLSLDNAAMIAGLAHHKLLANPAGDPLDLAAMPRLPIGTLT